jgi:outer membrane protein assembly factor BamB
MKLVPTLLAISILAADASIGRAQLKCEDGDWPGWRGPDRTGVSTEKGLLNEWPKGGPKLAWKAKDLGEGFSTPSVAGGKVFLLGTKGNDEYIIALDVKDGSKVWDTKIGKIGRSQMAAGPRSTPTIDGDDLYVIGSDGALVCADVKKGDIKWSKDLKKDFNGEIGMYAYSESPLVDGDVVVCTPGGTTATLAALKKTDGDTVWKAPLTLKKAGGGGGRPGGGFGRGGGSYTTAAYSSVIAAEVGGVRQYIQFLSGGVVGVSAKDGSLLWHYDHPAPTGMGTTCSTPLFQDDCVFAATGYNHGGGCAKISKDGDDFSAKEQYFVEEMQNQHGGMVLVDGCIYGTGAGKLYCVDFKTGKVKWEDRSVGKGSITYADGHLYVRSERGPIALVEANPKEYKETGRFDQPDRSRQSSWCYPVVAGGKLYLHDGDVLLCYDVKGK